MKAQYYKQVCVPDDQVKRWRRYVDREVELFRRDLEEQGKHPDYAPDMPTLRDMFEGFIKQPFRVLFTWIPDWSQNAHAGHHVIRIDTCERSDKLARAE